MIRFYAFSFNEVMLLSTRQFNTLWDQITVIEAQDQLKLLQVQDWPNLKKTPRQKIHKNLFNQAYPSQLKTKNYITVEELGKLLG